MKRLAVNIVILPPDPIMDLAIKLNRRLLEKGTSDIILDRANYLPHITMAMGCLREDQLGQAESILHSITTRHRGMELLASHINTVATASGDRIITLDFEPTPELTSFHESIVTALQPLLTQDATEADLYDLPPINSSSLDWINSYIPDACFENFWPHITLGFGDPPPDFQPVKFQASRLAICHLGNHCTCRKILTEVFLKAIIEM